MLLSAAIMGFTTLIFVLGGTLFLPICTPCVALPLGAVSGFLTSFFEKPQEQSLAFTRGAISGAMAGVGALLGQSIGALINGLAVGPGAAAAMLEEVFGFSETIFDAYSWNTQYWLTLIASTLCISLFNVLFMAGAGGLGGALWRALSAEKS